MNSNDPSKGEQATIISDEEFVSLITLKYQNSSEHVNDIERRKIWNRLNSQISKPESYKPGGLTSPSSKWNFFSQAVAVTMVLIGILPPVFFIAPKVVPDTDIIEGVQSIGSIKGVAPISSDVKLGAYKLGIDGQLHALAEPAVADSQNAILEGGPLKTGDVILFKAAVNRSMALALASSKNNETPRINYQQGLLPPGAGQLLGNGGQAYGYRLESGDSNMRFCAISASSPKLLSRKIRLLKKEWDKLPEQSCVVIHR